MAYRNTVNVAGASASGAIVLDRWLNSPVLLSVQTSGTVLYSVQHTFADPFVAGGIPAAAWVNHSNSVFVSATTAQEDNFIAAPTAVRLVNHTTTTGETTLTVIQTGGFPS